MRSSTAIVLLVLACCASTGACRKADTPKEKSSEKVESTSLPIAPMKFTPSTDVVTVDNAEIKEDGTLLIEGEVTAKISGSSIESTDGKGMVVIVRPDGNVILDGQPTRQVFEGDDLVSKGSDDQPGKRMTMSDDGTITATIEATPPVVASVGRWEGGPKAKRTAILATASFIMVASFRKTVRAMNKAMEAPDDSEPIPIDVPAPEPPPTKKPAKKKPAKKK